MEEQELSKTAEKIRRNGLFIIIKEVFNKSCLRPNKFNAKLCRTPALLQKQLDRQ